jgi:hypothetical protein
LNDVAQIKRSQGYSGTRTTPKAVEDQARQQRMALPCGRNAQATKSVSTRELVLRSASESSNLGKSRSTPSLAFEVLDHTPLALPSRRAPPQTGAASCSSNARRLVESRQRSKSTAGL